MKNVTIETDEWREKIERAFERMKKAVPDNVIIALVIAEKNEGQHPLSLSTHSNTCLHVCADLCKVAAVSLAAAVEDEECEGGAHSRN